MGKKEHGLGRDEILKGIISDYEKEEIESIEEKEKAYKGRIGGARRKKIFLAASLTCIILLIARLAAVVYAEMNISDQPKWVDGVRLRSDYMINDCIYRVWQIRSAADFFYVENRRFPSKLEELYDEGYLERAVVCPASYEEYIVKDFKKHKVFACPNPAEHGVKEIWCDVRKGPPAIERNQ